VVSAPCGTRKGAIESLLKEKAEWIREKLRLFEEKYADRPKPEDIRKDYLKKKELARRFITERLEHFSNLYGLKYGKVSVRNQRTCWGSCSKKGNLNFNYRLIDISPDLADYVIVHELCHTRVFDHSRKFWSLVGEAVPNYLELRKRLRAEDRKYHLL